MSIDLMAHELVGESGASMKLSVHNPDRPASKIASYTPPQTPPVRSSCSEGELDHAELLPRVPNEPREPQQLRAVDQWLEEAVTDFITRNPCSQAAAVKAKKDIPSGTTRSVLQANPFPLAVKSGHGATLTTADDASYIDFQSDYTAGLFGHSNKDIQDAIIQATQQGFSLGAVTTLESELSESIKTRFPSIDKVRFCNSGTEANMYAIGAAIAYTKRRKVLIFNSGYHGGALSFSEGASPLANPLNIPHDYVLGTYNDIENTRRVLSADIGVIIVEPMQSAGGMREATVEFLKFLRAVADTFGSVLIFDEVVTSRLDYGGLQGRYGIYPDMTTLGKYLGGGMPFGAFGGKEDIMMQFDPSSTAKAKLFHSGTFNNNVFTMTAAVAASKIVSPEAINRTNRLGDKARQGIIQALESMDKTDRMSCSGIGSCVGIAFRDHGTAAEFKDLLFFHMLSRGLWIGRRGFLATNFAHTDEDVTKFIAAFREFLSFYL